MKTTQKQLFFCVLLMSALAACNPEKKSWMKATPEALEFDSHGGEKPLRLESGGAWAAETDGQTWFSVFPASGSGDMTVTIKVDPNIKSTHRSASLSFVCEGKRATVAIAQKSSVPPDNAEEKQVSCSSDGGEIRVEVPQGFEYDAIIPSEATWVSIRAKDDGNLSLNVSENSSRGPRNARIEVKTTDGKLLKIIEFRQYGTAPAKGELLIEEIFFIGNEIPGTKKRDARQGDQYFILRNNSDHAFFADNVLLMIGEKLSGAYLPSAGFVYPEKPDSIFVSDVFAIPGNGKEVKMDAGDTLLIALAAQNFHKNNPNGFDLSKAHFEIYEISENNVKDTDNPDVKDLVVLKKKSYSYTVLHERGFYGYAIGLLPEGMTPDEFLARYKSKEKKHPTINHNESAIDAYVVSNEWVLDAVSLSRKECFYELPFNAAMDSGYSYCGTSWNDNPFGTCVKRRRAADGRLADTNNSTNDFTPQTTPSLKKQ